MAKHNLNNVIVDRVLRGIFSDKNDNIIFALNQVQNLSLNQTSESQEVQDALGVSIMELMRSKAIEASAENAIYDFGLLSAQYGTEKVVASDSEKLVVPMMETIEVEGATCKLAHTPTADITTIYELNGDSTLGAKYTAATEASVDKFMYKDGVITLPVDAEGNAVIADGTEIFVKYEYESSNAIEIINKANEFAKMGKMTFECLLYDLKNCLLFI